MKDSLIDGVIYRRAELLRPGDRIDLQGDIYADIWHDEDGGNPAFQFEFAEVYSVEKESADCVCVDTSQAAFGFPAGHLVKVDGEQVLADLHMREPLTMAQGRIEP